LKTFSLILFIFISVRLVPQSEDLDSFLSTGKDIFVSPLRYGTSDWINFSGVILATSGSFLIDKEVKDMVLRNKKTGFDINRKDELYYFYGAGILSAGIYGSGLMFEDNEIRQLGLDLAEAFFYASAINLGIKFISGRSRPYTTDNVVEFDPFQKAPINSALGSAHAVLAFSLASVMSGQSDNFFWKAGWYTAAVIFASARIYHNMHWLSDVILGSSIGYYVGSYVVGGKNNTSFSVTPRGVSIMINF
jgi:hypothetical protein